MLFVRLLIQVTHHKPARLAAVALLAVSGVLLLSSCGNDSPTECPEGEFGSLQGYVRASGHGISAEVVAEIRGERFQDAYRFTARSDSTGWYTLAVPPGVYDVDVEHEETFGNSRKTPDNIRVTPRVIPFDLERCRAEITLLMPEAFEGKHFTLELEVEEGSIDASGRQEEGILKFEYPAILPGFYTMKLSSSVLGSSLYLHRPTAPGNASHIWVDAEEVARFQLDYRPHFASISGTVTGSCLEEGYRPRISAISPDFLGVGNAYCDPDGSFELVSLVPGETRLYVEISGSHGWWFGGDDFASAHVFGLEPGDRVTGQDFSVSGLRIHLEGPGHFISHEAAVLLLDEAGNVVFDGGNFSSPMSICNLQSGRYFLKVDGYCSEQTWVPQWYDGAASTEDAVAIDLLPGEFREIEMQLGPGGMIAGELRAADGSEVFIRDLGLYSVEGDPLCDDYRNWRDFDDGNFTFSGLGDGDYFLGTRAWDFNDIWWYPGTHDFLQAVPITIENLSDVTGLSWMLPPETGGNRE